MQIIYICSFGYLYHPPEIEGALTIDCRKLPDPGDMFGVNFDGRSFVVKGYFEGKSEDFLQDKKEEVEKYIISNESKQDIIIRFGCTGGLHRSVYVADEIGQWLEGLGYQVVIRHLDIPLYE